MGLDVGQTPSQRPLRGAAALLPACGCICTLAWGCGRGEERTDAAVIARQTTWFTDVTQAAGLTFVHESGATEGLLLPPIMGSGVAMLDYDGDEDLDLYFVTGRGAPNRLYRQDAGFQFTDVTVTGGLGDTGFGMGVAVGDYDNDGDPDVYVTNLGPDALYRNRGDGTFEDVTAAAGIAVTGWSASAAFLDDDRDGLLDLFVTQYVDFDPDQRCFDRAGRPDYCGPRAFTPVPDVLLRNAGDGTFRDVSVASGIASIPAAGLGVVCEDLDGDGRVDIYVANDAYPNHAWLNRGDGTFEEAAAMLGAAYNLHGQNEAGMGVVAADLDNDALIDLFVTHLDGETNTLYRRLADGRGFLDVTGAAGLATTSAARTGFGVAAVDVELDGDLDLIVANGRVNRLDPLPEAAVEPPLHVLAEPNMLYINDGTGRFELISIDAATLGLPVEISRGLATGDIDGDGDLDVVLTNVHGPARLYRNDALRGGHWLVVEATGSPRVRAIGARVTLHCPDRDLVSTVRAADSYLSSSDPRVHFGLGAIERVMWIDVLWPDAVPERFATDGVDRVLHLVRGRGAAQP